MKTVGVVLSGCGVFDGAEIHESVLTILALIVRAQVLYSSRPINHNCMLLIMLPAKKWPRNEMC